MTGGKIPKAEDDESEGDEGDESEKDGDSRDGEGASYQTMSTDELKQKLKEAEELAKKR